MTREIHSLKEKFNDYFKIGAAVSPFTVNTSAELLKTHFNSVTAENQMKMQCIHPEEGRYDWTDADMIVDFAEKNDMLVRGHTLLWHNQVPEWIFTCNGNLPAEPDLIMERYKVHVNQLMKRYKGKVYCWDVVNEAVSDRENEYLRENSPWFRQVGGDFIEKAFNIAYAADPGAVLFYNDYGLENKAKLEKTCKLLQSLKAKCVPLHGIGNQAHWNIDWPSVDAIRTAIERLATLDLKIQITELDISLFPDDNKPFKSNDTSVYSEYCIDEKLEKLAERYEQIFSIFREYKDVIDSVTFWGVADDKTWLDDFPKRGRKDWPLLFDEQHKPKKAYWGIIDF